MKKTIRKNSMKTTTEFIFSSLSTPNLKLVIWVIFKNHIIYVMRVYYICTYIYKTLLLTASQLSWVRSDSDLLFYLVTSSNIQKP